MKLQIILPSRLPPSGAKIILFLAGITWKETHSKPEGFPQPLGDWIFIAQKNEELRSNNLAFEGGNQIQQNIFYQSQAKEDTQPKGLLRYQIQFLKKFFFCPLRRLPGKIYQKSHDRISRREKQKKEGAKGFLLLCAARTQYASFLLFQLIFFEKSKVSSLRGDCPQGGNFNTSPPNGGIGKRPEGSTPFGF
eukprot:TRINITY_DN810_c0_g1_i1.p4 TRINITY_DN810_c0_g1~~TRINITY_DN810_c0_g1_i1.p4  ORF type:complete len:192 (+),score=22.73 TRINITY_DN810_c0_g1_i1:497-1072(+)